MRIYISDPDYGRILDNTLTHIHGQSCGYTITMCMRCEMVFEPKFKITEKHRYTISDMKPYANKCTFESFFFLMCPACRTDMTESPKGFPTRSKQRTMIENMILSWDMKGDTDANMHLNPNRYSSVYVISVENGVEIILLVTNMNSTQARA
jgi:hypothetical protein